MLVPALLSLSLSLAPLDSGGGEAGLLLDRLLAGELPAAPACTACVEGCSESCLAQAAAWNEKRSANLAAVWAKEAAARPELADALHGELLARFRAANDARPVLLEFVGHLPVGAEATLEDELFDVGAESFELDHVLAFASRGSKACADELRRAARGCNEKAVCDLRPAVFVALTGDDVARPALERGASIEPAAGATQALLAALGLEALGDAGRVGEVQAGVMEATLAALDADDLVRARRLVAEAEFFADFRSKAASKKRVKKSFKKAALAGKNRRRRIRVPTFFRLSARSTVSALRKTRLREATAGRALARNRSAFRFRSRRARDHSSDLGLARGMEPAGQPLR